ncbi:hypothetical protein BH10PLA1_BH10PLA1_01260 [soil metagenome]
MKFRILNVGVLLVIACISVRAESDPAPPQQTANFVHPGLLNTEDDFRRMQAKVTANAEPWKSGWDVLTANPHANLDWHARPTDIVVRGSVPGQNVAAFFNDVHAAYQLALRWKVSGDAAYADKSIEILNAWSSRLKIIQGNADRFLAAGIQGYQFANAAEIMRTYPGWKREDFQRFQKMMLTVFYPMNQTFLFGRDGGKDHNGAAITNYWANWDLCNTASMMAIGVLCDRRDIYDQAIDYFKHGRGNGCIERAIYYVHPGNLGQPEEAGRDQGHTSMCIAILTEICEMAWSQGDDLYGYDNNRVLAGAEYVAKYNLGNDVPFQEFDWGTGTKGDRRSQTVVADRSRGQARPGWERLYNHYVSLKGIDAPYTTEFLKKVRPEGGGGNYGPNSGGFDQLGFGTLTASLDPITTVGIPTGLTARLSGDSVILNWWGVANAVGYQIERATANDDHFTTVATVKDGFTYTDADLPAKTYRYTVVAVMNDGKESRPCKPVNISTTPQLLMQLAFSSTKNATLHNGAATASSEHGNQVTLDGVDDYLSLPAGVVSQLSDFTIATWVQPEKARAWSRVFDFGSGTGRYMFFSPFGEEGKPRFAVSTVYGYNEQVVDGDAAFPTGGWTHVAITLRGRTATLYIDGRAVGSNDHIDFPPYRLGETTQNWIGRSQYDRDPYLQGKLADFRIYHGALNAQDLAALAKK